MTFVYSFVAFTFFFFHAIVYFDDRAIKTE